MVALEVPVYFLPLARDEISWCWAQSHDHSDNYANYLRDWPEGRHAVEARVFYQRSLWAETKRAEIRQAYTMASMALPGQCRIRRRLSPRTGCAAGQFFLETSDQRQHHRKLPGLPGPKSQRPPRRRGPPKNPSPRPASGPNQRDTPLARSLDRVISPRTHLCRRPLSRRPGPQFSRWRKP